jgi:hypothetical protein
VFVDSAIFGCPDVENALSLAVALQWTEDKFNPLLRPVIFVSIGPLEYIASQISSISYISERDRPKKSDLSIAVDLAASVILRPKKFRALPGMAALCIR